MKHLTTFTLIFLLTGFIFADKVATLSELTRPFYIKADDNHLFITDGPTINIYSLKDYSLVKRFGNKGEGPQEFKVNPRRSAGSVVIFIHPDYIFVNSLGKISYFTKKGEFIRETPVNFPGIRFQPLGKQFVGEGFTQENGTNYSIRNMYDSNFKKGKELYRRKSFSQPEGDMNPFYMVSPIMHVYRDNVYINDAEELLIHVFDSSGKKMPPITHEYNKLLMTKGYEAKIMNWYKNFRDFKDRYELWKARLKLPKYFPAIRWFDAADDKIYVLTHKKEGEKSEFYIFDIKGKFLKKIMVPLAEKDERLWYPYVIKDGKLYQLIENLDEEEWELHVTEIE